MIRATLSVICVFTSAKNIMKINKYQGAGKAEVVITNVVHYLYSMFFVQDSIMISFVLSSFEDCFGPPPV